MALKKGYIMRSQQLYEAYDNYVFTESDEDFTKFFKLLYQRHKLVLHTSKGVELQFKETGLLVGLAYKYAHKYVHIGYDYTEWLSLLLDYIGGTNVLERVYLSRNAPNYFAKSLKDYCDFHAIDIVRTFDTDKRRANSLKAFGTSCDRIQSTAFKGHSYVDRSLVTPEDTPETSKRYVRFNTLARSPIAPMEALDPLNDVLDPLSLALLTEEERTLFELVQRLHPTNSTELSRAMGYGDNGGRKVKRMLVRIASKLEVKHD